MKRVNKLSCGRIFRSWGSIFSVGMLLFVMGSLKSQAIDSLILNKPGWVLSGNYSAAALLSNPRSSSNFSYSDSLAGASYNSNFSAEYALDLTPVVSASEGVLEISFNYSFRKKIDSLLIEFWNADSARYVYLTPSRGLDFTTSSPQSNYCSGTFGSKTYKLWLSNFSSNSLSNFKFRIRYSDEGLQAYGFCIKDLRIKSSTCVVAPSVSLLASKALEADFRLGLSSELDKLDNLDNLVYKDSIKYELRVDTSSSFSNPRVTNSTSYFDNRGNNREDFRFYYADTSSLDKSYKPTSGTGTAATGTKYGWATSSEFQPIDTFLQYFGMSSLDIANFKYIKDKIEIDFYLRDRRSAFSSRSGHTGYYLLDSLNNTNVLDKFSGTPNYNFVVTYKSSGDSIKIEESHAGPNNYGSVYGIVIRSLFAASDLKASGLTQSTKYYYSARLKQCVGTSSGPWSASKTFTTKCGTAPLLSYTQDFESVTTVNTLNTSAFVVPKCDEVDLVSGEFRINYGSISNSRRPYSGSRYATVNFEGDVLFKTPLIKFQANSTYKFDMKYTSGGFLGFSYTVGVYKYRNRDSILAGKGRVMLIDSVVVGARSLNGSRDFNPYLGVRKYFNFNVSDSGNYYVVLRVKGNANPNFFIFDDINIDLAKSSTCFAPSNIVSTVAYGDSLSISYTSNSRSSTGSAMYQIDIAAPGIEAGLGSLSVVSDTFATLRGLTPLTNYRVYVRAICGVGDTSDWSLVPVILNSGCSLFNTVPYNYGFEISACWVKDANAKYKSFTYQSGFTPTISTGPSGASQGSKYVFTEVSGGAVTDTFLIYSPEINLDTVANKKGVDIQFDYHMFGAGMGNLLLQLERPINSGNYVTLVKLVGQQQSSSTAAWETTRYILPQDSLVDTLLKFRFLGRGIISIASDMSVDNFRVKYVVSSCNSTPSGFVTSEITATSAKVKWVEGIGDNISSYKVIYSRDTSIYGIEGTLYTAYDSVTVNGLMQGNTYKVYLTPICGTDTSKFYSYLGEITTLCSSLGVLPYNYGFETNSICWSNDANAKYKAFTQGIGGTPTSSTGPSGASQGSKYAFTETSSPVTSTDTFLIYSPQINLDTNANKKGVDIQFDYHMYGSGMGRLLLQLERPINSGNYVTLVEFVGQQQTSSAAAWKTAQYILPQDSLVDTLLKFRFLGTGRTSFEGDMAVDNFRVKYVKCIFSTEIRLSRSDSTLDSKNDKDAFNLYTTNLNSYTHVWSNSTTTDSVLSITSQMIKASGGSIRNEISVEVTDLNGCKARDTAYVYYKDTCTFSTEIRLSRSDSTLDSKNDKDAFNLYTTNPNSYRHVWSNSMTTDSVFSITSQMIKASGGSIRNEITVEVTDVNGCKSRDTAYVYYKDKCVFSTEIRLSRSDSTLDSRDDKDAFNLYTTNPNSYTHVWSNSTIRDSVFSITSQMIKASGGSVRNEITVEVTDLNGCKSRDTAYVYYKDKGIVNLGEVLLNLEVYPNPSKGIFSIEMNIEEGIEYVSYKVLDLTGRLVKSYAKEQGGKVIKKEIDISDKSEGVYILMIETERGVIVNRLSLIK